MWLSSCRIVMAPAGRPEKPSRYCEISASRSISPASTSCMTASAVKLLEIEPIRNAVSGMTSMSPPIFTTPRAPIEVISPSATTAYARPGTPDAGISWSMKSSIDPSGAVPGTTETRPSARTARRCRTVSALLRPSADHENAPRFWSFGCGGWPGGTTTAHHAALVAFRVVRPPAAGASTSLRSRPVDRSGVGDPDMYFHRVARHLYLRGLLLEEVEHPRANT